MCVYMYVHREGLHLTLFRTYTAGKYIFFKFRETFKTLNLLVCLKLYLII